MPKRSKVTKSKIKKRKSTRSSVKPLGRVSPLLLIGLGIFMCLFWFTHKVIYLRSLMMSRSEVARVIHEQPKFAPLPSHIFIPWNTNVDIEPMAFSAGNWQVSDTKVTYLLGSARPGEAGNIILYGHNKREILGNIRVLKGGEKITITTADNKLHIYVVDYAKQVSPSDVTLLGATNTETLTMYTCAGIWDSQRYIVRAIPIQ